MLRYCDEHQIRVPLDLSVVGYDNLFPAVESRPALSTVDNPIALAGRRGVELLIGQLSDTLTQPTQVWLDTGFVDRATTGPAP